MGMLQALYLIIALCTVTFELYMLYKGTFQYTARNNAMFWLKFVIRTLIFRPIQLSLMVFTVTIWVFNTLVVQTIARFVVSDYVVAATVAWLDSKRREGWTKERRMQYIEFIAKEGILLEFKSMENYMAIVQAERAAKKNQQFEQQMKKNMQALMNSMAQANGNSGGNNNQQNGNGKGNNNGKGIQQYQKVNERDAVNAWLNRKQ